MFRTLTLLILLGFAPIYLHCPENQAPQEDVKITPENADEQADQLLKDIEEL